MLVPAMASALALTAAAQGQAPAQPTAAEAPPSAPSEGVISYPAAYFAGCAFTKRASFSSISAGVSGFTM